MQRREGARVTGRVTRRGPRDLRAAALLAAALLAPSGAAQVANPNQIVGTVSFTNAEPAILDHLDAPGDRGFSSLRIQAASRPPAPPTTADTTLTATGRVSSDYEITVEGGDPGFAYDLSVMATLGDSYSDWYAFETVATDPVQPEPAPDVVRDVAECAALVRLHFVDAAGMPVAVEGGDLLVSGRASGPVPAGATDKSLIVPGDAVARTLRVEVVSGSDPHSDRIAWRFDEPIAPACDEVVDVDLVVDTSSPDLATIVGTADVVGEIENRRGDASDVEATLVMAAGNAGGTRRLDVIDREPSSGAFELENLNTDADSPQSYAVGVRFSLRRGERYQVLESPRAWFPVLPGEQLDLGSTFVIAPSVLEGDLLFRGPPASEGRVSLMEHLDRHSDRDEDADGIPDQFALVAAGTLVRAEGVSEVAPGATRSTASLSARAVWVGDHDPATGLLAGDYELVLGALDGEPGLYVANEVGLRLLGGDAASDPAGFVNTTLRLEQPVPRWDLAPGERARLDHAACFSEVRVVVATTDGVLHQPRLSGFGAFNGTDWRGEDVTYDGLLVTAAGTPWDSAGAAPEGLVVTALPAGTWRLTASTWITPDGGGLTSVTLPPFGLDVGCDQVVTVRPEVQLSLDAAAGECTAERAVNVMGRAASESGVARVFHVVNGGAEVEACADCGTDVPLDLNVDLEPGENAIDVVAVDALGREASVRLTVTRVAEPSALDVSPAVEPLRVARAGGDLVVSWQATGPLHALHSGDLDRVTTARELQHAVVTPCGLAESTRTLALPAGNRYFLATASCGAGETSYGRSSPGAERVASTDACF